MLVSVLALILALARSGFLLVGIFLDLERWSGFSGLDADYLVADFTDLVARLDGSPCSSADFEVAGAAGLSLMDAVFRSFRGLLRPAGHLALLTSPPTARVFTLTALTCSGKALTDDPPMSTRL
jgi:hypothetical protein